MTDDLDDLFEPAEEILYGIGERIGKKQGRYHYPAPPGAPAATGNGWMRMTNLAGAFSDQERLQLWLTWKAFMGLRAGDGMLFDEWMSIAVERMDDDAQKALANEYAERARELAHVNMGSLKGSAQHAVNEEYLNTGTLIGTRTQRQRLQAALTALEECDLELIPGSQEQRVWHPLAGGTMGTRDARVLCRRTGGVGTLDWKTQLRFWTFQEVCAQLYGYDSAPWWWQGPPNDGGRWVPAEPSTLTGHPDGPFAGRPVALVAHMPRDGVACTIKEVDLTYGKVVLETAAMNVALRSIGRSVAADRCPGSDRQRWVDTPAIAE
jgi:hypothetical protein